VPEIFQYSFMVRALIAGLIIGLVAPMIGMFLVLRRFAIFADALGHAALVGVALGVVLGLSPVLAAVVVCIAVALIVEQLRARRRLPSDATLALFLSGSLAVAIVIISLSRGFSINVMGYLFGSITTVQESDLWIVLALGVGALVAVVGLYKELFYISFDEESARVSGLPTRYVNLVLVSLAALTVALAMRIVGILLVGALMVMPVLAAFQLARSFAGALKLAVVFSLASVLAGLVSSYYLNVAAGGAIVIVALCIFLVSLVPRRA
jgi:zinc transport system permease protein